MTPTERPDGLSRSTLYAAYLGVVTLAVLGTTLAAGLGAPIVAGVMAGCCCALSATVGQLTGERTAGSVGVSDKEAGNE